MASPKDYFDQNFRSIHLLNVTAQCVRSMYPINVFAQCIPSMYPLNAFAQCNSSNVFTQCISSNASTCHYPACLHPAHPVHPVFERATDARVPIKRLHQRREEIKKFKSVALWIDGMSSESNG